VFALALAIALACPPSLLLAEDFLSEEDKEAAKSGAEAVKKAYEFGKDPGTEQMLDTAITAMSVGYPPAGAALGAMKGLMSMLGFFNKPDKVAEALKLLDARLKELEGRVKRLEDKVREIQNQQFRDQNLARIRELKERHRELSALVFDLKQLPTDPNFRRSLANRGKLLADSFLMSEDADLWKWSDLDLATQNQIPPDFKPLPTLEYYVSALVFWMAAIESAAAGDRAWVMQTYGGDLQRHAAFLSVRADWNDLNGEPETLPENIEARVSCGLQPMSKYPDPSTRMCSVKLACSDRMARRENMPAAVTEFLGTEGALCTLSANQGTPAEEKYIEDFYGVGLMGILATTIERLATTGTVGTQYVGGFDYTYYTPQYLYGVKPDGTLVWFDHTIAEDRNPDSGKPEFGVVGADRMKAGASIYTRDADSAQAAPESDGAVTDRGGLFATRLRKDTSVYTAAQQQPSAAAVQVDQRPDAAAVAAMTTPTPKISHSLSQPSAVGSGWAQFREIYPAGGAGIYALTSDGRLLWYRHDGWQNGAVAWKGPVQVGDGWGGFWKVVPGGDGVLYAIDQNADMHWYRENDYQDAQATPSWNPPQRVGGGWGQFVHVFSSGQGIIYAVQPSGELLWYKHTGYLTGAPTWEGPKSVSGSGWTDFSRVFSPGEGHIYAMRANGQLFWYRHSGWETGKFAWLGPHEVSSGFDGLTNVFARMWGTPKPSGSDVR
jgi:hypothetical protein